MTTATKSCGNITNNLSSDALLLLELKEKDRIIADLTHRIRTMSSVNINLKSEKLASRSYSQHFEAPSHTKSKSLPSEHHKSSFSLLKWFRRKRVSEDEKDEILKGVRRNSHIFISAPSMCFDETKVELSNQKIDLLQSSDECLLFTGYLRHELANMNESQVQEIKRRSLLLPHQLQSLHKHQSLN